MTSAITTARHNCVHSNTRLIPLLAAALLLLVPAASAQKTSGGQAQAPVQDLNRYPGLVPEFAQLYEKLQRGVNFPPPRTESRLLPLLPENTIFYAALPNYGDASHQALAIFHDQLQKSSVLRSWWEQSDQAKNAPQMEAYLERFYQFSQYLGEEVVLSATTDGSKDPKLLMLSEIRKPGLKEFLQETAKTLPANSLKLRVLYISDLALAKEKPGSSELLILVRPDFVLAATDLDTLRKSNSRLDQKSQAFASTAFGQRLTQAYQGGLSMIAAADLQEIIKQIPSGKAENEQMFERSGFKDAKYVVWEHNSVAGQPTSQMELSFNSPRHGIAAWLAPPGPIDSLDFLSPHTLLTGAVLLKNPADIFDDIAAIASASNPNALASLHQMEMGMKISLKEDLLRPLSGEIAYQIETLAANVNDKANEKDPVWRVILKVNDPDHLQATLQTLLSKMPVSSKEIEDGGITYHSLLVPSGQKPTEVNYAFVDGYMVIASSHGAAFQAVQFHRSGGSLARSQEFHDALPPGRLSQVSALFYEDPMAMAAAVSKQLPPEMRDLFSNSATAKSPIVMCAYGEESALREASKGGAVDVGGILIGAAIAIPNLLRARIAANEASAVGSIRSVNVAQRTYSSMYPQKGFAHDLASLGFGANGSQPSPTHAQLLDKTLAGPTCTAGSWCTKSGYRFTVSSACKLQKCSQYVAVTTPVSSSTGNRSFCSTSDAVVRFKIGPPLDSSITAAQCRSWAPLE